MNNIKKMTSNEFNKIYNARVNGLNIDNEDDLLKLFTKVNDAMGFEFKKVNIEELKKFSERLKFLQS